MRTSTIKTNIQKYIKTSLFPKLLLLLKLLDKGDLYTFEEKLKLLLDDFYNYICELMLVNSANTIDSELRQKYRILGFRKFKKRKMSIQLSTAYTVKLTTSYASEVPKDWTNSRYFLSNHWNILSGATLAYREKICLAALIAPSYRAGNELLKHFGIHQSDNRVVKIMNDMGLYCKNKEVKLSLDSGENVEGKRVVIGIDGGRTRTREYRAQGDSNNVLTYDTPWVEPKVFVIDIINESGEVERSCKPIYGTRFDENDFWSLLKEYLEALQIHKAKQVQIVADGAPWIWKHITTILIDLELAKEKIVETLDYSHAVSYVYKLVDSLPKKYGELKCKELLSTFKEHLWNGESDKIVSSCKQLFQRKSQKIKRWINYLDKHLKRTQYVHFQEDKLMCGSGIIESGIRRIINLRFKNASTFWKKENVENLFFFREIFLSYRWNTMIENLNTK